MQSLFSQVMLHIEEVIGGGTQDETVEGEVLVSLIRVICLFSEPSHLVIQLFLMEAKKSSKASSLTSLALRLTSVSATLTEDQVAMTTQLKSTLNDTIGRLEDEINALEFSFFEAEGERPSSDQITGIIKRQPQLHILITIHLGGSLTATAEEAKDAAASLLISQLKIVSMNTMAATNVASQLEVVLATEIGTETSGILAISGEEYFSLVSFFIQSLETNMAGASILTLSHSLSNVVTTLTQDQVASRQNLKSVKRKT